MSSHKKKKQLHTFPLPLSISLSHTHTHTRFHISTDGVNEQEVLSSCLIQHILLY